MKITSMAGEYSAPEIKVFHLDQEVIIATSSPLGIDGNGTIPGSGDEEEG